MLAPIKSFWQLLALLFFPMGDGLMLYDVLGVDDRHMICRNHLFAAVVGLPSCWEVLWSVDQEKAKVNPKSI